MLWWLASFGTLSSAAVIGTASLFFIPGPLYGKLAAGAWAVGALVAIIIARRRPLAAFSVFAIAVAGWGLWWSTQRPRNDRNWEAEYARQPTARLEGSRVVVDNLRNFDWQTPGGAVERWESRTFDLDKLEGIDLFASYWSGETIAHLILSFGFSDGQRLAVSVETRREKGEEWSAAAGFFRAYELAFVAADERDVVRLRTNVRGEDVRLYRLQTRPDMRKQIFVELITEMNQVAVNPRFYHSVWTNCTTQLVRIARAAGRRLPLDWRMLASGHAPSYLYDHGLLDTRRPFPELRSLAAVSEKGKAAGSDPAFSDRIREGIPALP